MRNRYQHMYDNMTDEELAREARRLAQRALRTANWCVGMTVTSITLAVVAVVYTIVWG